MPLDEFLERLKKFGILNIGSLTTEEGSLIFLGRPEENIVPFACKNHPIYDDPVVHTEVRLSVLRTFKITEAEFLAN
jgi:hypothetical protein